MTEEFRFKGARKLACALEAFSIDPAGKTWADLGCNVGGFTECLLKGGGAHIDSVDTGYGILDWVLRNDERVTVHERTNAMHWQPETLVDGVVIDVAWTRQIKIIPPAWDMLKPGGQIISLFKSQYEADKRSLRKGILSPEMVQPLLEARCAELEEAGYPVTDKVESPIRGGKKQKGNVEYLLLFQKPK